MKKLLALAAMLTLTTAGLGRSSEIHMTNMFRVRQGPAEFMIFVAQAEPLKMYQFQYFCREVWHPSGNYPSDATGKVQLTWRIGSWNICWGYNDPPNSLHGFRLKEVE